MKSKRPKSSETESDCDCWFSYIGMGHSRRTQNVVNGFLQIYLFWIEMYIWDAYQTFAGDPF